MVTVKIGDIFASHAQTLVNTVNCVGVMGKGIALGFRERFADMYEDYIRRCKAKQVELGKPYLFKRLAAPWILNFPTKEHWRSVSRLDAIVEGLKYLKKHYKEWGITSLAVPPLGCGHGQLEWRIVGPTLYRQLRELDIPVDLYAPSGTPDEELDMSFLGKIPAYSKTSGPGAPYRVDPAWIALVAILQRLEQEPYHRPVGRIMFQKIAYFATSLGIPTGLDYHRSSYGPNASDLKRHITALVNNGLVREEKLGRMFAVRVGQTFNDAEKLYQHQIQEWSPIIEKVADLFMRMNTEQAEIAASVHFAAEEIRKSQNQVPHEKNIFEAVVQWKQKRRPPLNEKDVALTIRNLNLLSWLEATVSDDLITEEEFLNI